MYALLSVAGADKLSNGGLLLGLGTSSPIICKVVLDNVNELPTALTVETSMFLLSSFSGTE
jgi:hypothetical protein